MKPTLQVRNVIKLLLLLNLTVFRHCNQVKQGSESVYTACEQNDATMRSTLQVCRNATKLKLITVHLHVRKAR